MSNLEREVVSTTTASKLLAVSDETIKRYIAAGRLEAFKLPTGHFRIYADSVEALKSAK